MPGRTQEYADLFDRGLKRCTRCQEVKPLSEFSPRSNFKGDTLPRAMCKPCCSSYTVQRREAGYNHVARLRRHGLRVSDFEEMKQQQNGGCAICGCADAVLYVDHNHATGRIRGLLCFHCNTALGHFEDDVNRLESAIRYLKEKSDDISRPQ